MKINEVIKQVQLSKRAVKYYEQEGLLIVGKDQNGYRNYSADNIRTLKEIAAYRKLGISIKEIKALLAGNDQDLLRQIYETKKMELDENRQELAALEQFINGGDVEELYDNLDYETVAAAICEMVPGVYGYYFMHHFLPYLQIKITTAEQREAYEQIISFMDGLKIKVPLVLRLSSYLACHLSKKDAETMTRRLEKNLSKYMDMAEEDYEKFREQIRKTVRMRDSVFYKYHPAFIAQRKFMDKLQDCGYNDIFIPNMIKLSPSYKMYHDALMRVNDRVCSDLGLYYDSNYNLVMKKK